MKPVREADVAPAIEVARARFADLNWLRRRAGPVPEHAAPPAAGLPPTGGDAADRRVGEATRILIERYRLTEAEATARLRRLARSSRRTVDEVADAIIVLDQG